MKITIRIPPGASVHGEPCEKSICQTAECRVLKVIRRSARRGAPLGAHRSEEWTYGAIIELPFWITLRGISGRQTFAYVSKRFNPRWEPPPFPQGEDTVDVSNET